MQAVGKTNGTGTGAFRITAAGEVLTKVHSDDYAHIEEAPHKRGWIPVYIGKLEGRLGFNKINNDPEVPPADEITIWDGFTFGHGERWVVNANGELIWKRKKYRFKSAFSHDELVARYEEYRQRGGRLYINEYGHIFVNAPAEEVPPAKQDEVLSTFETWKNRAKSQGDSTGLRLVTRRLKATSPNNDPKNGHLPLYIGHLEQFDEGLIPRPVVTDMNYYVACSKSANKSVA
ncbi:hypothetical protein [Haladaptatus sp. ZSTT2]|uniref:hypothetical protein n=1 Tax=Haladaptatus sp. ZSTT2 TaxID=3120515 RepID=UPI00300ECCC7